MAKIIVEQSVLVDRRYQHLGTMYHRDRLWAIGCMIFIWQECQEVGNCRLTRAQIEDTHPRLRGLPEALIESGLASLEEDGSLCISGVKARVERLGQLQSNAEYGALGASSGGKGGRPRKTPIRGLSETPIRGLSKTPIRGLSETPSLASASAQQKPVAYTPDFLRFWEAYPRKRSKNNAYREWRKLSPPPDIKTILAAIERQKANSREWQRGYIKDPERWLKAGGWEDECPGGALPLEKSETVLTPAPAPAPAPDPKRQKAEAVWHAKLKTLRTMLSAREIMLWFAPLRALNADGPLTLQAPNPQAKAFITANYGPLLAELGMALC